ncbi:MAG: hypothetical protein ACI9JT_000228 [Polaribacter sp.]|jgi:hypothetical protein
MNFTLKTQTIKIKSLSYRNKNKIFVLGLLINFLSFVLADTKWGIAAEDTIASFLCTFGTGIILLAISLKKLKTSFNTHRESSYFRDS